VQGYSILMALPLTPQETGDRMVWLVPSRTKPNVSYRVDATGNNGAMWCACPDFRIRRQKNIDAGLPPLVPRSTICHHCEDLIFHFCRLLFADMARSESQPIAR
jgi:hypothetical protein